ncbi:hypothetical protein [Streptomyces sp. NPDC000410]|uniref:hypothetical protein n=1 Tax=Streptomyces sp. NPDC000410 TaxID=3154254 RepID=UPI003319F72C
MTDQAGVAAAWDRVEEWLSRNAPSDYVALRPPAEAGEIEEITEYRFDLHPDVATLLRRHDGSGQGTGGFFLPGDFCLYSAAQMRDGQRGMERSVAWSLEGEGVAQFTVRQGVTMSGDDETPFDAEDVGLALVPFDAHVKWVPIGRTASGDELVVDHREGDAYGSVRVIASGMTEAAPVWWDSVADMLQSTVTALETMSPLTSVWGGRMFPETAEVPGGGTVLHWELA